MLYVSVTYAPSMEFNSPESWFKRTRGYAGALECLSRHHTVINLKQINYEGECTHNGVQYHFKRFGDKKKLFPWRQNRYVKSLNPDIVIVQGLHNPLQLIQLGMTLDKKTKIIAQNHAEKPFRGVKKYIQKIVDLYVDAYLFASHEMGMDWVKQGNIKSAKKLHEVMEVSSVFYPIKKAAAKLKTGASGKPLFLWVGRLNANKDPLNVVKAFLRFTETSPGARLYMIYHTDELLPEVKKMIEAHRAKRKIILVGQVPNDDLLYWYNSADFFISGSHYEGSGTAVCEAMSCGCIPIVTDIASFRMITDGGSCGMLYEAGNTDALLAALQQTQNIDIAGKQKRSLAHFEEKLSFNAIAKQINEIALSL